MAARDAGIDADGYVAVVGAPRCRWIRIGADWVWGHGANKGRQRGTVQTARMQCPMLRKAGGSVSPGGELEQISQAPIGALVLAMFLQWFLADP
eukprot:scaffold78691_cov16-Tisochrysis_lutea.AAC.1